MGNNFFFPFYRFDIRYSSICNDWTNFISLFNGKFLFIRSFCRVWRKEFNEICSYYWIFFFNYEWQCYLSYNFPNSSTDLKNGLTLLVHNLFVVFFSTPPGVFSFLPSARGEKNTSSGFSLIYFPLVGITLKSNFFYPT